MTNEEAIAYFKRHIDLYCVTGICREAEEMAIKALEQQPCDDAISREAALEKMADYVASGYADSAEDFEEYSRIICQLPSVTQKSETVTEFADRGRECGKMRKGHWIWNFDKGYCKCSKCGIGMGHKEFDYCPNCGAKMQESEDKAE